MSDPRFLLCLLTVLMAAPAAGAQSGANIALGKKYTLSPAPNYPRCTDPGDAVQLTDGQLTKGQFWTQQGTVGWSEAPYVTITVDLERVEPIGGVSFRTAAGAEAVQWPAAIHILTSDDGKSYRDNGDLIAMELKRRGPWPTGYAVRQLAASELHARGRFVRFLAVPLGAFLLCDEVEVFRGSPELLQGQPGGTPVADVQRLVARARIQSSAQRRFETDIAGLEKAIDASALADPSARALLRNQWTEASAALRASKLPDDASFRAVLPYNEAHARLFQVQAALWKAQGRANLTHCVPSTWDPTDLYAIPSLGGRIEVHTMRGEYRAAAVNLANASAESMEVRMHFDGLPGSPAPDYVTVHEVPWTDTVQVQAVAAALPLARRDGPDWRLTVLPGLVRQAWLTFHVRQLPPGDYTGGLTVDGPQSEPLRVPIRLRVYPLDFPRQTTLQLGGFEYTDGDSYGGLTPRNRNALISHLQERFVNAPWASESTMMKCDFAADGTVTLDTQAMDEWLARWPNAKTYYVAVSVIKRPEFDGAKMGTPEFDRKVGAWISAWVRHLGSKGISPERLGLALHDETAEGSDIGPYLAWAKAIRAAEPKVLLWEDPTYNDPAKAPAAYFAACDVLCPNRPQWLNRGEPFARFYRDQQRQGRALNFYACWGAARLLDPYSYYRLQAWHCWQIGATGSFFWAFGDNGGQSSWNEYPGFGGHTPLFLDETSVTAAKQMEAIREGVEDYEYFVLLRAAVDKAKAAGRSDSAVAEGESLLTTAADGVLAAPGASSLTWHTAKDRTKADAVRIKVLETLSALGRERP
jgi:hypothetical protein